MNGVEKVLVYGVPVILLVVEGVALLTGLTPAPHRFLGEIRTPFFALAAIMVAFVAIRRKDMVPLLVLGSAVDGTRLAILSALGTPVSDTMSTTGAGYWIASILLSVYQALRSNGAARRKALDIAAIKFALPGSIPLTIFALWQTSEILHHTYDNYFYAFDGLLSFPAAEVAGQFFITHPWGATPFRYTYGGFMMMACFFIILEVKIAGRPSGWLLSRWIAAGLFGCALYFVIPGIGPNAAFDTVYPGKLPDPSVVPLALFSCFERVPRNAMPSLHTTWALLIAIAAWRMGMVARIVASLNAIGIAVATLGLREHYLVDLIVAIPFTVAVHGFVSMLERQAGWRTQATAAIAGSILTGGWLLIIRYGTGPLRSVPWIASLLVLGTLIFSAWLYLRMKRGAPLGTIGCPAGQPLH
jgi:hypothetical protein